MTVLPRRAPVPLLAALFAAALCTCPPALAAGRAEVSAVQPEHFADAGRGQLERERTLEEITGWLQRLARALPDGQTLRVEITDIDLAGDLQPMRIGEVRVLTGRADWPRIRLRYTLLDGDRPLKSGRADLSDLAYLSGIGLRDRPDQPLAYEKRMLRRWFEDQFTPH